MYAIKLSHDNSGISPGWFVEHVTVEDMESMKTYDFPVGKWFSKNEGDGLISREIDVGKPPWAPSRLALVIISSGH